MARIEVTTFIQASTETCFDLARNMRVHEMTTAKTGERIVEILKGGHDRLSDEEAGRALLELDDVVTFEAKHLGVKQRLTSKIVEYKHHAEFIDAMQKGAFKSLVHIHRFEAINGGTNMIDILEFQSPGWIFGALLGKELWCRHKVSS